MMLQSSIRSAVLLCFTVAACASTTSGARPHDMGMAEHEHEVQAHAGAAEAQAKQYDPSAKVKRIECSPGGGRLGADLGACWTSVSNPTVEHLREADEHRRHAADHRLASRALAEVEARACAGIGPDDRDISPFDHVEDIANVNPLSETSGTPKQPRRRKAGAVVTFRAVPGMTAEWLQRVVDCHLARNSSLGHVVPEMSYCPLVPKGVTARVTSRRNGFAIAIRSSDSATAREILRRAEALLGRGPTQ